MSFHNRSIAQNSGIFQFTGTVLLLHYKLPLLRKMAERDGIRTDVADLILTQVQQGLFWFL